MSDLTQDADDAALVNAVIALAHSMKLNMIAEGGTSEQLALFSLARVREKARILHETILVSCHAD